MNEEIFRRRANEEAGSITSVAGLRNTVLNAKQLKRQGRVRVRKMGSSAKWCYGVVELASETKLGLQSVALSIDGVVEAAGGFIASVLPLLIDYNNEIVTGLTGDEYELEVE